MAIKGLLFDKDGTLIEFHQMWLQVTQNVVMQILQNYPSTQTQQSLLEAVGIFGKHIDNKGLLAANPVEDIAQRWYQLIQPECELKSFIYVIKNLFNQHIKDNPELIKTLPGVKEKLLSLKNQGFKLGIATADTKDSTLYSLNQAGLFELFDFIGYSDGNIAPKPATALMNAFCNQCGLTTDQVIMFGDTISDMEFGHNSGSKKIAVLTGTATETELKPHADMILASVSDFEAHFLATNF